MKMHHSSKEQCLLPKIEGLIDYLGMRSSLPASHLARAAQVVRNLNNYQRFDSGWLSAFKDIAR
jgi:hypothetical protein